MKFIWKGYQIKSYEYGYIVQKQVGRQWKVIGHYSNLKQAVKDLFEHRVLTETADCIVNTTDEAAIRLQSAHILQRIKDIAHEIQEGLNHDDK